MRAEEELQLPARDTRNIDKAAKKEAKDVALGRRIREESGAVWPPPTDENENDETERDDSSLETTAKHKEKS